MATQTTIPQQAIMEVTCKAADTYPRYADVIGRAGELLLAGKVERVGEDRYRVQSRTRKGREYLVTSQSCGCEQFSYTGRGCLHQWAACYLLEIAETRAAVLAARAERDGALTEQERRRAGRWKLAYAAKGETFTLAESKRLAFTWWRVRGQAGTRDLANRTEVA